MPPHKSIILFETEPVRREWSEKEERWYFSIVDVVRVLTEQTNFQTARKYWNKLKERLKIEGNQTVTNCHQLKLLAEDGKMRLTDVADVEILLRIIQSIPSPKAEPFKIWLAKVGYERLKETIDPEGAVIRARNNWLALGRSPKWIEQRMRGQEIRNKLTDYWGDHGVSKDIDYAKLTDIIHREWSGVSVKDHKQLKNLKGHNLRDHMSEAEILFTSLAELSTRQVAETDLAEGYDENAVSAVKGGRVAGNARHELEKLTGKKVISPNNFLAPGKERRKIRK